MTTDQTLLFGLYEMLAGKAVFFGKTPVEVAIKHVEKPPPLLPDKFSHIQPILSRMLEKRAIDRYETIEDALADLQDI